MLALSFLILVGVVLIAEGFDHTCPKGYIYFAMAFSVGVEMLNIRLRKKSTHPCGSTRQRCLRSILLSSSRLRRSRP